VARAAALRLLPLHGRHHAAALSLFLLLIVAIAVPGLAGIHVLAAQRTSGGGGGGAGGGSSSSMSRMMRVSAEMSSLPSLAVHWASSILVRQDASSMDLMRAAMVGPADTPYAGGFLLFDILLPATYPQVPPSVKYLTTGGGQARFNPNLYAVSPVVW
jgi:hypothetical protein